MGPSIQLLGRPRIYAGDGEEQAVRGHQAWAILARVLLSRTPIDRRTLALELFPETVDPLGSVRWCLASLRRALQSPGSLCGDPIESNLPPETEVDVWRLEGMHLRFEDFGDLLDGVDPRCSPEFSTWLLIERERVARVVGERIRQETLQALSAGQHDRAIRLAELGVRREPFDESAHILLVNSLAAAGRYEAALDHVEATEASFLAELGERPSAALRSAARRTVSSPPGGVSPDAVVNSLLESGLAALAAGAADAGIDCLRRAVSDAERFKAPRLLATTLAELGTALVHAVKGYDDEGAILLRRSTDIARQSGYADIGSTGLRELGYVEALAGRRPAAEAYLSEGLALAPGSDSRAGIHSVMGFNLVDWGRIDEGLDHYSLSLDYARSSGNRRREIWSLGVGGWGQLAATHFEEADRWLTDCLALIEEQRWVAFRPWPIAVLAESKLRQKQDPAKLRPSLEEAFALSCQLGDPCWEAANARTLALLHMALNELSLAADWLTDARKRCVRSTDKYAALLVKILTDQMELCLRQEKAEQANAIARELVSVAARAHMDAYVNRAAELLAKTRA